MDSLIKYMLLKTVQDNNILPISSVCNMACQFCSHRNNPPGLDVYRLGHLDLSLITELLDYLPDEGPVIIGESATRIIEGDPMTHPDFINIIEMIRNRYPEKVIKITTNGSFLSSEIIRLLEEMEAVELNISVNCSNPAERVFLMGDKSSAQVFSALEMLSDSPLVFNGSIVAMPHLLGWDSLDHTIKLLNNSGAETIRVFMPGFTRYSNEKLKFNVDDMYRNMTGFIKNYDDFTTPVLLEPPLINDFNCTIKGIIKNSPAAKSLLKKGDIIKSVDQESVISRVDGFNKIFAARSPVILYERDGLLKESVLDKKPGESSGIILDYDIAPELIEGLAVQLLKRRKEKTGIITSTLGKGIMNTFLNYYKNNYNISSSSNSSDEQTIEYMNKNTGEQNIDLLVVENKFFAGSIRTAGLLTATDIINHIKETGKSYDYLILPGIIFDVFGNDLTGKNYRDIEEKLDLEVAII